MFCSFMITCVFLYLLFFSLRFIFFFVILCFFFFKQKTAYEMRISDWSSDVCSSDLLLVRFENGGSLVAREALHGGQQQGLARARRQGGQASLGNRLAAVAVAVVVVGRRLEGSLGGGPDLLEDLVEADAGRRVSGELIRGLANCLEGSGDIAIPALLIARQGAGIATKKRPMRTTRFSNGHS